MNNDRESKAGTQEELCWFCRQKPTGQDWPIRVSMHRDDGRKFAASIEGEAPGPEASVAALSLEDTIAGIEGAAIEPVEKDEPEEGWVGTRYATVAVPRCGRCHLKHARASQKGCTFAAYGAGFGFLLGVVYGILERKVTSGLIGVFFGSIIMSSVFMGIASVFTPVRGAKRKNHALKHPRVKAMRKAGWLVGRGRPGRHGTLVWTRDE